MGFNQQDIRNIERAVQMFGSYMTNTDMDGEVLLVVPISLDNAPEAAKVLSAAMMSAMLMEQGHGVWINVKLAEIPDYVAQAIGHCQGFGLRLVVTHGDAASHAPGAPLPPALVLAVAQAADGREVWHPKARCLVPSIRHLAKQARRDAAVAASGSAG